MAPRAARVRVRWELRRSEYHSDPGAKALRVPRRARVRRCRSQQEDPGLFDAYNSTSPQDRPCSPNPGAGKLVLQRSRDLFALTVTAWRHRVIEVGRPPAPRSIAVADSADYTLSVFPMWSPGQEGLVDPAPAGNRIARRWSFGVQARPSTDTRHSAWTHGHTSGPPSLRRSSSASGPVNCSGCATSVSDR